jgi:predicted dehydrogenase
MKTIAIIGAGQLGSRHLQGVLKSDHNFTVYVVEPNIHSVGTAKERATEIAHQHPITWLSSIDELPKVIDLCIIATSAGVRAMLTEKLLKHATVGHLILEKVLFTQLVQYERINQLLEDKNTPCTVNHPRRMYEAYQFIQEQLESYTGTTQMRVYGHNWGLACNGLHFLDMFYFITGHAPTHISTANIDPAYFESKRAGYIEFNGTLEASSEQGDRCTITCVDGPSQPIAVIIEKGPLRFDITEGREFRVELLYQNNPEKNQSYAFIGPFQGELSKVLVDRTFDRLNTALPNYMEAQTLHLPFITAFLQLFNGDLSSELPIT